MYEVLLADNALLEQSYRLRYEVYVSEFGWEEPNEAQREHDAYDDCARHIVAVHDGHVVGTCRLITCRPLPIETYWDAIHPQSQDYLSELTQIVEISRLAITREHRNREAMSLLVLGILAVAEKAKHGHGLALMSPVLPRLLRRIGVEFCLIGDEIEHKGKRAPYYITTGYTLDSLTPKLRPTYKELRMML